MLRPDDKNAKKSKLDFAQNCAEELNQADVDKCLLLELEIRKQARSAPTKGS